MNAYNIKINGKWFVETGDVVGMTNSGGWYDTGKATRSLILSDNQDKAKQVEGMRNLNSYYNKIYDSARATGMEIEKLTFVKVGEV
ncbi:hypothetical protein JNUCC1_03332 [Lentibacillus sp. JNUCC-1]|uniref:hypothetical protein n=1 Tax=Lentibacillus sp. JNUCC-1 TaxID=2654513 RepID=UPI0012E7F328|nr:hypothetical protein [Lentibacillus sp. JNUCC-1]MUV39454.1 hypothetical protein [Lentibacillus sp. JNUCC-1]